MHYQKVVEILNDYTSINVPRPRTEDIKSPAPVVKPSAPIEKVQEIKVDLNRADVRVNQQVEKLEKIDGNLKKVFDIMLDDNTYEPKNKSIINMELTELKAILKDDIESTNSQNERMFDKSRAQTDMNNQPIAEFGNADVMEQSYAVIDTFIADKNVSHANNILDVQEDVVVEIVHAEMTRDERDNNQVNNSKVDIYTDVQNILADIV